MKNKIYITLILLIGFLQMDFADTKRSIDVLYSNLVRVEHEKEDYSLVFEIMCSYNGVKDSRFAFVIVPLDKDMEMIYDSQGHPLISAETFRMLENTGEGMVEMSVPLSYFPKNTEEFVYRCMIADDETDEIINDFGPYGFSIEEVNHLLAQKANDQTTDILEMFFGGLGAAIEYREKYGNKECNYCNGNRKCSYCGGDGLTWDEEKCTVCNGTGKCSYCDERGTR